jgi:queuine tRNA-ribosyltransferase
MHNLSVLDAFFTGIRDLIKERGSVGLDEEVARFVDYYDEPLVLVDEGWKDWKDVEVARGKGRFTRERGN